MAVDPSVVINLAAEFTGKKAFGQADAATKKLMGGVKKLAGAIGIAYSARAIVNYSKAAMKAAADDQKAQKILASNLKNVGLAYASIDAESFIANMEKQTAILDDQLRPAYAQLAQVTGSVSKTQDLMSLAFDVSSGSGIDYASTIDIISQAYVGNTKGLKQLNLGLTQAELKAMSFQQVQDKLRQNFTGAGGAALDTYAGSMAKLSVATNNASETIGLALLDAIVKVSGSNGVDGLISKIDTLASSFASVVTQVGNAVAALTGQEARKAFSPGYYVSGGKAGGTTVGPTGAGNMSMSVQSQDLQLSALNAKKKAELDAIKRNKELAKLAKSQAAAAAAALKSKKDAALLDKASLMLAKGQDVFNMDAIQLNAAVINQTQQLGNVTSSAQLLAITNDLARLRVKQDILDLEKAIASGDAEAATAAAAKLNKDLLILGALQNQQLKLTDIKAILNSLVPKDLINLANLNEAIRLLTIINNGKTPSVTNPVAPVVPVSPVSPILGKPIPSVGIAGVDYNPSQNPDRNYSNGFPNGVTSGAGITYNPNQQGDRNYDIKIYANTIANPDELSGLIQDTIIRLNKQGDYITTAGAL